MLRGLAFDIAHTLSTSVLLLSFALLYQRRLPAVLNAYAMQGLCVAGAAAWQGFVQHAPDLYWTAGIAALKAVVVPLASTAPSRRCCRSTSRCSPASA